MNFKLLYSALMINSVSIGVIITVVPLYIDSMGVDSVTLGFIVSAYAIAYVVASPIWGKASDILGRKWALVLGMSGYSFAVVFYSFVNDPLRLLPIRLLQGFTDTAYWSVPTALSADVCMSDELGKTLGKVGTSQGMGLVAGPLVGGILIGAFNYSTAFYFCSTLTFLAVLLVLFGVHVKQTPSREVKVSSRVRVWSSFDAKVKRSFVVAYLGSMVSALSFGVVISNFLVHANTALEGNKLLVGLLLASYYLIEALIQPLAGRLSDVIGRRPAILLAFATGGFGFFTLLLPFSFVSFLIAIVIVGAGVGQLHVTLATALMDLAPPTQRGLVAGLQSIAWGVGYFLGPMIGGIVAVYFVGAPYIFCVIASAFGGVLTLAYRERVDESSSEH